MSSPQTAQAKPVSCAYASSMVIPGIEHLPIELLDEVLDELSRSHPQALAHCVAVSRLWSKITYPHRFRTIVCKQDNVPPENNSSDPTLRQSEPQEAGKSSRTLAELALFLKTAPRLAAHAKSLVISGSTAWTINLAHLRVVLVFLSSLHTLELEGNCFQISDQPEDIDDPALVPRQLQQLTLRKGRNLDLATLLSLFSSVVHLKVLEGHYTSHTTLDVGSRTPVSSLSVATQMADILGKLLPIELGEHIQTSSLQHIEVSANLLCFPGMLTSFIRAYGSNLRSLKIGHIYKGEFGIFLDLSTCLNLENLRIVVLMPWLDESALARLCFPDVDELTWSSVLRIVCGTSSAIRTLSLEIHAMAIEPTAMPNLLSAVTQDYDIAAVVNRLAKLDWGSLERGIENRRGLEEFCLHLDTGAVSSTLPIAEFKTAMAAAIRSECFKSEHVLRRLQVSVTVCDGFSSNACFSRNAISI